MSYEPSLLEFVRARLCRLLLKGRKNVNELELKAQGHREIKKIAQESLSDFFYFSIFLCFHISTEFTMFCHRM